MVFKRNRVDPNQVPSITLPSPSAGDNNKSYDDVKGYRGKHVEVFVKCRDIISVDLFSKTDPFIVFYVRRYGKWLEYGRTETIPNACMPSFTETFCVETINTENNQLKASLFDGENMNSQNLQKCRHLGSVEFELNQLTSESFTELLITQENGKTVGVLCLCGIHVENIVECKKEVRFSIGAGRIAKRNFFNRANVYMEISRELFKNTFHTVYRSEVIFKTNTPHWKLFTINAQRLCNNNKNTNLLFQIFDHNAKGEPEPKGQVVLSLAKLIKYQGVVKEINLKKLSFSKRSFTKLKDNNNAGYLKLYHVSLEEQYSLIDYIRSGIKIKASIAIDFTLSNGHPLTNDTSLHYVHPLNDNNEYIHAIKHIGTWISYYCDCIPMVGFGGKLHPSTFESSNRNSQCYIETVLQNLLTANNKLRENTNNNEIKDNYCFPISTSDSDVNALIESYKRVVCMVEAGGPTYFRKVLSNMLLPSKDKTATTPNDLSIILVITDGVSNDEHDLETFLLKLTEEPVIIIVAGVGPCLFTPTEYLVNRVNRKVKRRMVFFYKVNDTEKKNDIKELYASISKATIDYFVHNKIYPKHVTEISISTLEMNLNTELNYRPNSPMFESKACCPTCGSYVDLSSNVKL